MPAVQHYNDFRMANGLHLSDPGAPASPLIATIRTHVLDGASQAWILS